MNEPILSSECPLQGDCQWKFLYQTTGNYKNLSIYKCESCGLQALYPRPVQSELYGKDYYLGKAEYSYVDERSQGKHFKYVWRARLKNIQKYRKEGIFLDVGSSFGGFLREAKSFGYEIQGVEISEYASKHANELGIPTFNGSLLKAKFPDNHFSIITLIEVMEHLERPNEYFLELSRILKPGGLLLLQTANFEGLQAIWEGPNYHYYMPGHVFYYSHTLLEKILTHYGFTKFVPYYGVDFPLLAKLLKSRGNFRSLIDYLSWFKISFYHFKSKIRWRGKPLTSSYVLYAFKKD